MLCRSSVERYRDDAIVERERGVTAVVFVDGESAACVRRIKPVRISVGCNEYHEGAGIDCRRKRRIEGDGGNAVSKGALADVFERVPYDRTLLPVVSVTATRFALVVNVPLIVSLPKLSTWKTGMKAMLSPVREVPYASIRLPGGLLPPI